MEGCQNHRRQIKQRKKNGRIWTKRYGKEWDVKRKKKAISIIPWLATQKSHCMLPGVGGWGKHA